MLEIKPETFDSFLEALKGLDYTGYAEQYPPFGSWGALRGRGARVLAAWRKCLRVPHEAGLFINVPFCRSKCRFCFLPVTCIGSGDPAAGRYFAEYFEALDAEAAAYAPLFAGTAMRTVYVGGGSPSLMTPAQADKFFALVRRRFRIARGAQILLELHPSDITPEKLRAYRAAGVNRVCLGAQSLDRGVLSGNARLQCLGHVEKAYRLLLENGLDKVNMDLICGLPGQTGKSFLDDLKVIVRLRPDQVHLNTFINTPYTVHALAGGKQQDGELVERTRRAGFRLLEASGYCRIDSDSMGLTPESRNRQTSGLSGRRSILGLGPGAVSRAYGALRCINRTDWAGYRKEALSGGVAAERGALLGPLDEMIYCAITRLSDDRELDTRYFERVHGHNFKKTFGRELAALKQEGAALYRGKLKAPAGMWNTIRRAFYRPEVLAGGLRNLRRPYRRGSRRPFRSGAIPSS